MSGPYSSDRRPGFDGAPFIDTHPSEPIPAPPPHVQPGPPPPPSAGYSAPLPYPKPHRRRLLVGGVVAVLAVAAVTVAILQGSHGAPVATGGAFSHATATSAIQNYLDALENRDTEAISRHALCGIYDAVRDRRSDQAVAKLSSDAFRKQFSEARVTSIDKVVYWSDYQAQVLFSMRVQSATGGGERSEVQGVAQLISQHNQVLVCSYVLRTAGMY